LGLGISQKARDEMSKNESGFIRVGLGEGSFRYILVREEFLTTQPKKTKA
jgi:hypothetical protein